LLLLVPFIVDSEAGLGRFRINVRSAMAFSRALGGRRRSLHTKIIP
jgi:hypothetical protein